MTHRVYLHDPTDRSASHETVTDDKHVAWFAFERLCKSPAAAGHQVVWNEDAECRGLQETTPRFGTAPGH